MALFRHRLAIYRKMAIRPNATMAQFHEEVLMVARNISHFDVRADDVARARKFYERVFEWRFSPWGPPGFFLIATGTEADPGIHGAVHDRPADGHRSIGFQCTISV